MLDPMLRRSLSVFVIVVAIVGLIRLAEPNARTQTIQETHIQATHMPATTQQPPSPEKPAVIKPMAPAKPASPVLPAVNWTRELQRPAVQAALGNYISQHCSLAKEVTGNGATVSTDKVVCQ